ncbi:terminase TerL endonuclease subunit [Desulfosporosinus nitroreducens]|uniref:terminase TerL endonuclease subunit n=1 Tax=Desulfosporosinus nitroreducens TaxID=2018668 RepID=UPI00207D0651|nr:terminase TerL endonuclease subunit [Desulfosporosinus nitroreducens]MCO1599762.1 terminase large subunit [Desulfosporosinus nitroreducens]
MSSNINPYILRYIEMVETGEIEACEEQQLLVAYVRKCFATEEIYTDSEQLEKYLSLVKYFPYDRLFEWEEFCLALHCCTYRAKDDMPRWPDLFALMGRGGGKDGYIALESFCLMSEHNGILRYDIDICANNEDQAKAPFDDIYGVLETPEFTKKLKRFFYWNKEEIISLKTKSKLKYRTNSPKGKDGLRSGAVIFNEIHQYQDYANINVFTTGLGKKKHPRRTYATTNGDVRDGPLDHLLERSEQILRGDIPDNGLLPFICKLDDKEEIHEPKNWDKANPSLRYLPNLQEEMAKEYEEWKLNPSQFSAFMTKRMNIPDGNKEIQVTDWENIKATNKQLPELTGRSAVVGIDYSKITDFASAVIHFREGNTRYDISHSWLCSQSADIPRLKIPWREWEKIKLLTVVDDVEINPDLIAEWIASQAAKYNLVKLALDNYRYALLANSLKKVGFDAKDYKNVKLVRPSDIMQISPVIDSCFAKQNFIWGDNPLLRWATNNTKLIKSGVKTGNDTGNYVYGKIEAKSRKTDPFIAVVAAMTIESELGDGACGETPDIGVYTY